MGVTTYFAVTHGDRRQHPISACNPSAFFTKAHMGYLARISLMSTMRHRTLRNLSPTLWTAADQRPRRAPQPTSRSCFFGATTRQPTHATVMAPTEQVPWHRPITTARVRNFCRSDEVSSRRDTTPYPFRLDGRIRCMLGSGHARRLLTGDRGQLLHLRELFTKRHPYLRRGRPGRLLHHRRLRPRQLPRR